MRRALLGIAAGTAATAIILGATLYVIATLPLGYVVAIAAAVGLIWLSR